MDANTGWIVASTLTISDVHDPSQGGALLDQVTDPIVSCIPDGAYD
jgi:hypothetical protein